MNPDDLDDVDREIRLNKRHNEVEDHVESGEERQPPEANGGKGLEYLSAWEDGDFGLRPADLLVKMGISMQPPDELDAETLPAKLNEVIQGLAKIGAFIHGTRHLSDEELYRQMWSDMLFKKALLIPQNAAYAYHWDPLGSGSDEDFRVDYMYADDAKRERWLKLFPDYDMPPQLPPKSLRDATLPRWEPPPPPEGTERAWPEPDENEKPF